MIGTIRDFAEDQGIRGGRFAALGAVERATIAYWNRETKEYEKRTIDEQWEVLSLTGNIALADGETKIHAHVTLGRRDLSAIGGHLMSAVVYPTLELHLAIYGTTLVREIDEETKLPLIVL